MTKIVEIWACSCKYSQIKSHVIVNGMVTFWLISTSVLKFNYDILTFDVSLTFNLTFM